MPASDPDPPEKETAVPRTPREEGNARETLRESRARLDETAAEIEEAQRALEERRERLEGLDADVERLERSTGELAKRARHPEPGPEPG
jgi:predicted  nucleic acid-binding Zn-ribbon protein